jgi:hypothetical protein
MAVRWALAAILLALAGHHLRHLVRRDHRPSRDVDVVHAGMGAAMAAVLIVDAGSRAGWPLALAFAAATLWFGARSLDPAYGPWSGNLRQSACCAAMVAMLVIPFAAPAGMGGMGALAGTDRSTLALLGLLALQAGLIAWTGAELARTGASARPHVGAQLATIAGGAGMVALML